MASPNRDVGSYFVCITWENIVHQMGTTLFNASLGKRNVKPMSVRQFEDMCGLLRVQS